VAGCFEYGDETSCYDDTELANKTIVSKFCVPHMIMVIEVKCIRPWYTVSRL
jgi:hypothetical protein